MRPSYVDGDWVLVEPVAVSHPVRVGEVVLSRWSDRLVTHRVVSLRDGAAVTRGDACSWNDPPIPLSALLGRVIEVRRGARLLPAMRRAARKIAHILMKPVGGSR
jgi:signal peptidase I